MIAILPNKCVDIEDVVSYYKHQANTNAQMEDGNWKIDQNPNYVELDLTAVYNTLLKNKELIYNNPLAMCESGQWVFVNRTLYGPLLLTIPIAFNGIQRDVDHSDFTSMATIAAKVHNNHHITKRRNIFMRDF